MRIVDTDRAPKAIGPYSQGIVADRWFFSSGQIPLNVEGQIVGEDVEAQAEQVFENLRQVLAGAGSSLD
jgi:2-iminobutanoate/2-iminopropanoate deaminase